MFELRRSDDGLISISDSFTNFSVVTFVDLTNAYPTTTHYPFTDETLVFSRVLRYSGGLPVRRFIFCERKTSLTIPSTGEPGLVLYNAEGTPVFSSSEEYVKFVSTNTHSLVGINAYGPDEVIAAGTVPAPKHGGYVYVLQNSASVVWTISGNLESRDVTYVSLIYKEVPPANVYVIRKYSSVNFFPYYVCGIRYSTSSGHVVSFAEFSF